MNLKTPFKIAQCHINPATNTITFANGEQTVVQKKFIQALSYMAHNYPKATDKSQLITHVWGEDTQLGEQSLNNAILKLRHELREIDSILIEQVNNQSCRLMIEPIYDEHVETPATHAKWLWLGFITLGAATSYFLLK